PREKHLGVCACWCGGSKRYSRGSVRAPTHGTRARHWLAQNHTVVRVGRSKPRPTAPGVSTRRSGGARNDARKSVTRYGFRRRRVRTSIHVAAAKTVEGAGTTRIVRSLCVIRG